MATGSGKQASGTQRAAGSGGQAPTAPPYTSAARYPDVAADSAEDRELIRFIPAQELPSLMRIELDETIVGITFAMDILEGDGVLPRLILHAWAAHRQPNRIIRPQAAPELRSFPITVKDEAMANLLRGAFRETPALLDFVGQGLGLLQAVQKRTWQFVGDRDDGTHAEWKAATRARDPLPELLDWMDTVGGRLCHLWTRLAAVNQDRHEIQPTRYEVRLRTEDAITIWQGEAYALTWRQAAIALMDKMDLITMLRRSADRIAVKTPEDGRWRSYLLSELYTQTELDSARARVEAETREQAHRRRLAVVTAADAQQLRQMSRDWLRHPIASLNSLWAEHQARKVAEKASNRQLAA